MTPNDQTPIENKPILLLLHGWGYDLDCWAGSWMELLSDAYQVIGVNLPGHGEMSMVYDEHDGLAELDEWINKSIGAINQPYHLLGWSLGGQVALRIAGTDPRVQSVVLLATNPKFVTGPDWPLAMDPQVLEQFLAGYKSQPTKTLRRFASLQAQGATHGKRLQAELVQKMRANPSQTFGLTLLQELDERTTLSQLKIPCYLELPQADSLVPYAWVDKLSLPKNVEIRKVDGCHGYIFEDDYDFSAVSHFLKLGKQQ